MRRAVLATTGISTLTIMLLALKPHQVPALAGVTPRTPTTSATPHTSTGAGTGTFTGDPVDTQYGPVQVSITLTKGKITAVKVLQAPDQNGRDQEINSFALPRLAEEALGAQSAQIDAVSGASYTSQGYIQSLQSALDQAHA
ncbi:FMN-binding protein [Streptomyces beijiangensis]|uniref:FMN-binding protein n=1 Tax=Streptomyces beijiangensis TaxID=163361 RepID=A0A939F8Q3_9ACTN|nr:FMN-binding protein [Streptomyces beijiangensis]MBO0513734.1 FMN-binding protein [Streptomyces beijiangensis]